MLPMARAFNSARGLRLTLRSKRLAKVQCLGKHAYLVANVPVTPFIRFFTEDVLLKREEHGERGRGERRVLRQKGEIR